MADSVRGSTVKKDAKALLAQAAMTALVLDVDIMPIGWRSGLRNRAQVGAQVGAQAGVPAGARGQTQAGQSVAELKPSTARAAKAKAMDALRKQYEKDEPHKAFGFTFQNIVWGDGDCDADLMFIGEAPGAEEDRLGMPFVGRAGQLLERMIGAMGLSRESVYIANVLKVRPPNNATPTIAEREASKSYLFDQIAIVQPKVIVTLGLPASSVVLNSSLAMGKLRGVWATFVHPSKEGVSVEVMPTYHPSFLLRSYSPENRKLVWSDLQKVMGKLGLGSGGGGGKK
jgi:uracil-DNA glycosylase family 4